jgi:hypothetical protein
MKSNFLYKKLLRKKPHEIKYFKKMAHSLMNKKEKE